MSRNKISLLAAVDATEHVHLILGTNSLASSRVTKSLEVGAKPIIIAPSDEKIHFGLQQRVVCGEVQWMHKDFEESDLSSYGREEIGRFADAVFVTSGAKSSRSECAQSILRVRVKLTLA